MGETVNARILGVGHHVPANVVTNDDLTRVMDTSDEWIQQRTGIRQRHFVTEDQGPADLAIHAAREALDEAKVAPADLAPLGRQVEARRVRLGSDDQHVARRARPDERVGGGEHVEEARALVANVHCRYAAQSQMAEQHGAARRHVVVRRERSQQDEV